MSNTEFINLSEIYLPTAGGSIDGDVEVGGALQVNDGSGAGTNYDVAHEITELKAENEELRAAWDSVSQSLEEVTYDTGWENVYYVDGKIKVEARRVGKMVTVNARAYDSYIPAGAGTWTAVTTLPSKFRPSSIKYVALGSELNNHVGMADIEPDGLVYVISAGSAIGSWGFSITYPVG